MSGEVIATPVAKYGRSSEFGVVLDFIQTMISDDTLRQAFNIWSWSVGKTWQKPL